jgi:hypothetical protein
MDHKCKPCPTKEDLNIFKEYDAHGKKTLTNYDDFVKGLYIKDDKFAKPLEPGMVGKIVFDNLNDPKINVIYNQNGLYDINMEHYCFDMNEAYDEKKMCRYYREGICILTGCDIVNMIKPCSCKEKRV